MTGPAVRLWGPQHALLPGGFGSHVGAVGPVKRACVSRGYLMSTTSGEALPKTPKLPLLTGQDDRKLSTARSGRHRAAADEGGTDMVKHYLKYALSTLTAAMFAHMA
ncbi:hypothetical protein GCM10010326_69410 [Streptomyces xanthochromogenes]|uniref:Uncharacterized protein n=2 Tax=Streptomyces TaxID=1883 RepID=A0ABQ3AQL7_9ACTN|nr:hypothetical protein GCM10010326_69410 [Streptomyces xanthochromogenes]